MAVGFKPFLQNMYVFQTRKFSVRDKNLETPGSIFIFLHNINEG
jgi:hypothetical protein